MIPGKEVGSNEASPQPIAVELIAVLVAVADGLPLAMTIEAGGALPSGPFAVGHRSLQALLERTTMIQGRHRNDTLRIRHLLNSPELPERERPACHRLSDSLLGCLYRVHIWPPLNMGSKQSMRLVPQKHALLVQVAL